MVIVTVVAIDGLKVKLGVSAPFDTAVHREEVYRRIKRGNESKPQPKD